MDFQARETSLCHVRSLGGACDDAVSGVQRRADQEAWAKDWGSGEVARLGTLWDSRRDLGSCAAWLLVVVLSSFRFLAVQLFSDLNLKLYLSKCLCTLLSINTISTYFCIRISVSLLFNFFKNSVHGVLETALIDELVSCAV